MTWQKTPADRQREKQSYGAGYRRSRAIAMRRDNWRCQLRYEGCAGSASQCDHIINVASGGTHDPANLRAVCQPCHLRHTARQGGGWRAGQPADPDPRPRTGW